MKDNKAVRSRSSKNTAKSDRKIMIAFISVLFLVLIGAIGFVVTVLSRNNTNTEIISMHEYKNINPNNLNIILEDIILEEIEHFPLEIDGVLHLPVDFISSQIGPHIFWEADINLLTMTTLLNLVRIEPNSHVYMNNFRESQLDALVHNIGDMAYLPLSMVHELYDIKVVFNEELNMLVIDGTNTERVYARVAVTEAVVRHEPDQRSYIAEIVYENDILRIFEAEQQELEEGEYETLDLNGHIRVRTSSGNLGFILEEDIQETERLQGFTRQPEIPPSQRMQQIDGRLNMTWDLLTNRDANNLPWTRVPNRGVNVLSPTWFSFDMETYNGDVISLVSREYVEWAHSQGIQVWPLVFDYEDPDVTGRIMTVTDKRDHVITQFIDIAEEYNLDGINVDFERIRVEEINYFLQFLRELSPMMRERDLVLSVAVFVPAPWTMYFNRPEISRVADLLTVMAYDENVFGQPSGPNASIGFVHRGIVDTLAEVPPHQVVLGLPFYTRIWREVEVDGEIRTTGRSVGVQIAQNFFADHGVQPIWLEQYGSYYAEVTVIEDGQQVTYRAWLECERSLELKMQIVGNYDIAGVASWTRGLARTSVWDVIYENLN